MPSPIKKNTYLAWASDSNATNRKKKTNDKIKEFKDEMTIMKRKLNMLMAQVGQQ